LRHLPFSAIQDAPAFTSSGRRIESFAGSCRIVFNKALALQKDNYEAGGNFIGDVAMAKRLN